jgi:hypothetical protein
MGTFTGHEWQALAEHVAPYRIDPEAPDPYVSTFNAAVREARYVCGRDVDTGQRLDGRPVAIWAGTLVYLVLLERGTSTKSQSRSARRGSISRTDPEEGSWK